MDVEPRMRQWPLAIPPRVKWSAVAAGWAVGLATQMVLTLLGLAIGAWSIDLHDPQPAHRIPLGTGIWTGISMLISAFVGGYITARSSGSHLKSDGLYHGVVVWGVNWLIFAWLTTTTMAYLAGGLFTALGMTVEAAARGVKEGAPAAASQDSTTVSLSVTDLRKQVESVLQSTAKQELQPGEMQKDAERLKSHAKSGQSVQQLTDTILTEIQQKLTALDREAAVNVMMNKLGMSEAQARQVVQTTVGVLSPLKQKVKKTAQEAKQQSVEMGTTAINRIGTIAMWLFVLAVITLVLSVTGGLVGTSNDVWVDSQGASYSADVRRTA